MSELQEHLVSLEKSDVLVDMKRQTIKIILFKKLKLPSSGGGSMPNDRLKPHPTINPQP